MMVIIIISSGYKRFKELKGVACGFLAVWALTAASPVIAANLVCHFHFSVIT